jgi:cytochrome c nitrite reductase small subunit
VGWLDLGKFLERSSLKLILLGIVVAVVGMALSGAGFVYSSGPDFCGSCHSMNHVYYTWQASNHKTVTCSDCHVPHDNILSMMYVKGENGMRDVYHEFLRDYPDTLYFTPKGKRITEGNCLRCHFSTVENTAMAAGGQSCIKCHRGIVHGQNRSPGGVSVE